MTVLTDRFISNNRIAILEGLENNPQLEELHVDHQFLEEGESFDVSPETATSLSVKMKHIRT